MPGVNRHRPPGSRLLFNRIYRQQKELEAVVVKLRADIVELKASHAIHEVVAQHCRRLIKENATYAHVVAANQFMSAALPRRPAPPDLDCTCLGPSLGRNPHCVIHGDKKQRP